MKYLGLHKLIWLLLVLLGITVELIFVGTAYILYFVWNLKLPEGNVWHSFHNHESKWDGAMIEDYNPWQTLIRRYNLINE